MVSCILSSTASVYAELVLKNTNKYSIHFQNILFYSWGAFFSFCVLIRNEPGAIIRGGFFDGYSYTVISLIICQGMNGIMISYILRFSDNIVRIYSHVIATALTILIEMIHTRIINYYLFLSVVIVACSLSVYHTRINTEETIFINK